MLKNYLLSALRNMYLRRFYSMINVLGLTLGLTAAALTILYVRHESGYDNFFRKSDHIYRISARLSNEWFAPMSVPYSATLCQRPFSEIETCARFSRWSTQFVQYGSKKTVESKALVTDPGSDLFNIFDFRFLEGTPDRALSVPHSVVLTSSLAHQLFGDESALNKFIRYDTMWLAVTGVIADVPSNSHLDFGLLFTDARIMKDEIGAAYTYCVLSPQADRKTLKKKIMALPKPADAFSVLQDLVILPLKELHFQTDMKYELKTPGNRLYLYLFVVIGTMIMALSCMNYMGLTIAMYGRRQKEIAVRKVAGAANGQLAVQFLLEGLCFCLICLPLTLVLLQGILPFFNRLMGVDLKNEFTISIPDFLLLVAVTVFTGLLSAAYPALLLPNIKAIMLFKKAKLPGRSGFTFRQGLVTFQVTVLMVMISSSWIISNQLRFIRQQDMGFQKEGVLKLKNAWRVDSSAFYYLKNELLSNPDIKSVSQGYTPGDEDYGITFRSETSETIYSGMIPMHVDFDYLATMGIMLIQSDFNKDNSARSRKLTLINETLARQLGYSDPIGRQIIGEAGKSNEWARKIDGVFKDFNYFSLHQAIPPMLLSIGPRFGQGVNNNILVKISLEHVAQTLRFIREKTGRIIPDIALDYEFLDDSLDKLYEKEQRLSSLCQVLLIIDVLLALIGLLGLASYISEQRTKEIGIRKVLGASIMDILQLMSRSFVKITFVAIACGSALSILFIHQWLNEFAYRVRISWTIFAGTAALLLFTVLLTVIFHGLRVSLANPVKSLRTD